MRQAFLASAIGIGVAYFSGTAFAANPTSWEVGSEFDDQSNTCLGTVWCYGFKPSVVGPFSVFADPFTQAFGNELGWADLTHGTNSQARVYHNINPYIYTDPDGPTPIAAHALILHPGDGGQYSTLRFTVPYKGKYRVSGQFYGIYDHGTTTTTDVHIIVNNNPVALFNGQVNIAAGALLASFTHLTTQTLYPNDTIDFEVGYGSNGNYTDDWTGLNAVIERAPKK